MNVHATQPTLAATAGSQPPQAKIVATLGPASDEPEMVARLVHAGVNVFRLNFSHGSLADAERRLQTVRAVAGKLDAQVAVFGDLSGPKIRVKGVPDVHDGGGIVVEQGQDVIFRRSQDEADPTGGPDGEPVFGTTFDPIFSDVELGQRVLINDGAIRMLAVDGGNGEELRCRVTLGGRITSKKGINLPESDINAPALTERDWECVRWGCKHVLDYFALSFVRRADDVVELKERMRPLCRCPDGSDGPLVAGGFGPGIPVISKIEKPQAVAGIERIVEASDAVMVARGDLGVEMDVAQVPIAQKHIIAVCREFGRPSIVATQMLETMIENASPTRAEASDVANAIFDGADAVMLSGETAVGKHPTLVVETMRRIVSYAEQRLHELRTPGGLPSHLPDFPYRSVALAVGARTVADHARCRLVVVWSEAGGMARYLSSSGFTVPIVAFTTRPVAARRMQLFGNVHPVVRQPPPTGSLADWTDMVEALITEQGWAAEGDAVLLIAGKPLGGTIAQDIMGMLRIGDEASGFRGHDSTSGTLYGHGSISR